MKRPAGFRSAEGHTRPPRLAERLLRLSLPTCYREQQLGDLREAFVALQQQVGRRRARRWYRIQVAKSVMPNLTCTLRCRIRSLRRGYRAAGSQASRDTIAPRLECLLRDLTYAARTLWRSRLFTAAATLTLALGVGASTAIVSVSHSVLLRPLPYQEPARLVDVGVNSGVDRSSGFAASSEPELTDLATRTNSFEQVAAYSSGEVTIGDSLTARRVGVMRVTTNLLPMLGVSPLMGRWFSTDEGLPGGSPAIVLSHGIWQQDFGGDPNIIGSAVSLHDFSATFADQFATPVPVVGVMPPAFEFPDAEQEAWVPLRLDKHDPNTRGFHYLQVLARLRSGTTIEQAQSEANVLAAQSTADFPEIYPADPGYAIRLQPYHTRVVGHVATPLLLLVGAVAFVLLTACVNVANLVLARGEARKRDIAIRTALGARPAHVVRQLLLESSMLTVFGGLAGLSIAVLGVDVLRTTAPSLVPRVDQVHVNGWVFGLSVAIALGTGIMSGVLPASRSAKAEPRSLLGEGRGAHGGIRSALAVRRLLVLTQVGFATVLVTGAGLMLRSVQKMYATDTGFRPENVLSLRLHPPSSRYSDDASSTSLYRDLVERLNTVPGVVSAGGVFWLPMASGPYNMSIDIETRPADEAAEAPVANMQFATPGYFETLGLTLVRGRLFDRHDDDQSHPVVVISESLALMGWGGADPIGKRMRMFGWPWMEVIGIVKDVRHQSVVHDPRPTWYVPHAQGHVSAFTSPLNMTVLVRADSDPESLAGPIREAVAAFDPSIVISRVRTLQEVFGSTLDTERLVTVILSMFGAVALSLAVVGVYGLISLTVSERTREIGLRVALGAACTTVLLQAIREALVLSLTGVVVGLLGSLALSRGIETLVFGITPVDPLTYGAVSLVLTVAAVGASLVPAHRASRVDPLVALRSEC